MSKSQFTYALVYSICLSSIIAPSAAVCAIWKSFEHDRVPLHSAKTGRTGWPQLEGTKPRRVAVGSEHDTAALRYDGFAGHSGRVGMAQALAADGAGLPELMEAGR